MKNATIAKILTAAYKTAREKGETKILTHPHFMNNCLLSKSDREYLDELANWMQENDSVIELEPSGSIFSPYVSSYNGTTAVAGIKISTTIHLLVNL